jgi:hypothetical protein
MREYLASIDWRAHPGHFLSLTYHPQFVPIEIAKEHLAVFRRRLEREFKEYLGCIWKEEFQDRGTVHFHLVVFWKCFAPSFGFPMWVATNWYEIVTGERLNGQVFPLKQVGGGYDWYVAAENEQGVVSELKKVSDGAFLEHGTKTNSLETSNIAKFMRYCSKYLTKDGRQIDPSTGEVIATGRIWGHWGEVDTSVLARMEFSRHTMVQLCRRLRRWGKSSKYISRLSDKWSGFLLWGDGWQLCELFRGLEYSIRPG